MGTLSCRSFVPTPHQEFAAQIIGHSLKQLHGSIGVVFIHYKEGALLHGRKYAYGGQFRWETKKVLLTRKFLWWERWKVIEKYVLCYYPRPDYCIQGVKARQFAIISTQDTIVYALWLPNRKMWELVEEWIEE